MTKTHRCDSGFSLAAVIFFAAIASIMLAAAVPAYQMQAKRELEEELIFRGGEYTRAIQKYQRKFGVYPTSIDQLVSTNGLRFVRHAYKDPITGKDFRLITVNPDGSLNGSKTFMQNKNNQPLFGNTQNVGSSQNGQQGQSPQQQSGQSGPFGQSGQVGQTGQLGQSLQQLTQQQNTQPNQQQGQQSGQPGGFGIAGGSNGAAGTNPFGGTQRPGQSQPGLQGLGNPFGSGTSNIASGGIIGVASDSDKDSIKVYNNHQKYDEWEFLAIFGQQAGGIPQRGQQGQQGQQGLQGQPQNTPPGQRPNPFPNTSSGSPFGGPPTGSPFGGPPTSSPFGPGPGAGGMTNPFGSNNPQPNRPTK
jgi:type II secretory pathway pseudopilin PulG